MSARVEWNYNRRGWARRQQEERSNALASDKLAWWKTQALGPSEVLGQRERALFHGCCTKCFPQSSLSVDRTNDPACRRSLLLVDIVSCSSQNSSKSILETLIEHADQPCQVKDVFERLQLDSPSSSWWQLRLENWLMSLNVPKLICHSGQLDVLSRNMRSGHPVLIVSTMNNVDLDALAINSALKSSGLNQARLVVGNNQLQSKHFMPIIKVINTEDENEVDIEGATVCELMKNEKILQLSLQNQLLLQHIHDDKKRILGHLVDLVEMGALDDVLLVPAAVSYDPPALVSSLSQSPKSIRVEFDQPRFLKDYLEQQKLKQVNSDASSLSSLLLHLRNDSSRLTKLMPTSFVAFVLAFMLDSNSTTTTEVEERLSFLLDLMDAKQGFKKHDALAFTYESVEDIVQHGLEQVPNLSIKDTEVDLANVSSSVLLAMAENVVKVLAPEAMVATALAALTPSKLPTCSLMDMHESLESLLASEIRDASAVLAHLLQDVFLLRLPCESDDEFLAKFSDALSTLVSDEIVISENNERNMGNNAMHLQDRMARNFARNLAILNDDDDSEQYQAQGDRVRISLRSEALKHMTMLVKCVQGYTNALNKATKTVLGHFEIVEKATINDLIKEAKKKGDLDDWQMLNVRRVLHTFVDLGVLMSSDNDDLVLNKELMDEEAQNELRAWASLFARGRV